MRDEGLKLAIEAAGSIGSLARRLGITQPSVSSWARIPADRVIAIEAATGVGRERLRPDLYALERSSAAAAGPLDEIERARAREYLLLAKLLRQAPTTQLLMDIAGLRGDESPLGMARIALAEAAGRTSEAEAGAEYFNLFIGIGRGELLPYASYYLTGFLHERPLASLRQDLARLGIERAEGNFDPEDHLGLLLETMGGFADGTFEQSIEEQRRFFDRHISPWADRFFADLAVAQGARFYKEVAALGSCFLEIERTAFHFRD